MLDVLTAVCGTGILATDQTSSPLRLRLRHSYSGVCCHLLQLLYDCPHLDYGLRLVEVCGLVWVGVGVIVTCT